MIDLRLFLILLFAFIFSQNAQSQTDIDSKYAIINVLFDDFVAPLNCEYFNEKPLAPEKSAMNGNDTITLVDPVTYEVKTILASQYDSLQWAQYQEEIKLWDKRTLKNPKVVLLSKCPKTRLESLERLTSSLPAGYEDLQIDLINSSEIEFEESLIKPQKGGFKVLKNTFRNAHDFKYLDIAHVVLSDIILSKDKTKAIAYFSIEHKITSNNSKNNITIFGGQFFFKKENGNWKIALKKGFWEF